MEFKISILMGIYNCADTLSDAIESILKQTYDNWELILCDDASIDDTYKVAYSYNVKYPEKIVLIRNERNMGLNYTLNRCLAYATGDFIGRMDGDDLSHPERFKREIEALKNNKEVAIVSTDMEFFDENGVWGRTHTTKFPQCKNFLKGTPFCHAACLVRKEAYNAVGGYSIDKKLLRVEDYHLWVKMYAKGYKGMNIQESLYQMRDDRKAQKRKKYKYRINEAYVKAVAVKQLRLPLYGYLYCLKPLLIGLLPPYVYNMLHRKKQSR